MILILNIIFALLGGWLTHYLCLKGGVDSPIAVVVAVLVGILIFFLNLASHLGV